MTQQKLLSRLSDMLDMKKNKRKKLARQLRTVLKQLKHEENKLTAKCNHSSSRSEKKSLQREIAVLHAKRKKGLKALKKVMQT